MWASSYVVSLELDQSLLGHSHKFYASIVLVHPAGRTSCRLKVYAWVGVLISLLETLPDYRK